MLSNCFSCHARSDMHNEVMSEEKAAINEPDGAGSQGVQGGLVENSSDLTMLKRLANHPEWRLPEECFGEVPQAMAEIVRDPQKSARQKTSAAKVLASLHNSNHNHLTNAITVQHRVEGPRSMLYPVRPQGEPTAFLEVVSQAELRATYECLRELNLCEEITEVAEPEKTPQLELVAPPNRDVEMKN